MSLKLLKPWINPLLVGLLILFSLPLKLPALQQTLESLLSFSFPIRLSLYTLLLPPVALFSMVWNRKRAFEIWQKLQLPLILLAFLFCWMWLGAIMSEYPKIALKHSGRYSIYLLTFLAFLFALERDSLKKSGQIFTGIYVILMALTFLDLHEKTSIPRLLAENGLHIDLFFRGYPQVTSFFENRNPYAVISIGVFFWSLANLRHSWILSSLAMAAASYSIVLAGSRNGILTLVLCLMFLLILTFKQIRKARAAFIIVLVAAVAVGIGYYSLKSQTISRTNASLNRLLNVNTYEDLERMEVRFIIFRAALNLGLAEPPILGSGTKTFGHEVFSKSKDIAHLNNSLYKNTFNSHNAPLTIWIEMGWVGLLAVLLFLWLWFRPALRGPPLIMMPMLAVCVGQILDYFVWEIFFMAFQSFFFAYFAANMYLVKGNSPAQVSNTLDHQDEA
jgi:O-antigen ligase